MSPEDHNNRSGRIPRVDWHVRTQLQRLLEKQSSPAALARRDNGPAASLQWLEMRHAEVLRALPFAVYTTDAAVALWGGRPMLGQERWCGSWRSYTLDGFPLPHDRRPMAVVIRENRTVRGVTADCGAAGWHPGSLSALSHPLARCH